MAAWVRVAGEGAGESVGVGLGVGVGVGVGMGVGVGELTSPVLAGFFPNCFRATTA